MERRKPSASHTSWKLYSPFWFYCRRPPSVWQDIGCDLSSTSSASISSARDASNFRKGEYWKPLSEIERTIQHDMATYNTLNPECGQRQCKSAHGRAVQWGCSAPCWHRLGSTAIMAVVVCRSAEVHIWSFHGLIWFKSKIKHLDCKYCSKNNPVHALSLMLQYN